MSSPSDQVKFILDSVADAEVILLQQMYGPTVLEHILYLTRTWANCMHRQKMIVSGRWSDPGSNHSKGANPSKYTGNILVRDPTLTRQLDQIICNVNTNTFSFSGEVPFHKCLVYDEGAAASDYLVSAIGLKFTKLAHLQHELQTLHPVTNLESDCNVPAANKPCCQSSCGGSAVGGI